MTASWKIFAFAGGVALAGAVGTACTITSNGGDDDGGLFTDDDSGAGTDTGTPDTGSTTPSCADQIYPDGGTTALSLGSADCTTCTVASCCTQLADCFQDPTGDCQDLETCLENVVENPDAGVTPDDCAGLHPDSVDKHTAWSDCQQANCNDAGSIACQ
jgi:hypothetical protein